MKKFRNVIYCYISFAFLVFLFIEYNNLKNAQLAVVEEKQERMENKVTSSKKIWKVEPKPGLTAKGGFMDGNEHIRKHFEKEETMLDGMGAAFELGNIRLICKSTSAGRCEDAIFYFIDNPTSVEAAFLQLKDHIPSDFVKINEFQLAKDRFVYNFTSELYDEHYKTRDRFYDGEGSLEFIKDEKDTIFAVVPRLEIIEKK